MKDRIKDIIKNNKGILIIILIAIIAIIAVIIAFVFNKDTYAIDNSSDHMEFTCDNEVTVAGAEIECSLSVNVVSTGVRGFQSDIETSEGLSYVDYAEDETCSGSECWDSSDGGETKIIAYKMKKADATGFLPVGTFKYKVSEDATPGQEYTITLKDAYLGWKDSEGETQRKDLENASSTIRIASNVNTLDNITLSTGSLNEEFQSNVNTYTATINENKITINVTKTDENATIEGNLENIDLHYGTNKIDIKVISEGGSENIYTVNIYRPYEFNSYNYTYNKEANYLYTKADSDSTTIISNISLPDGLSSKIENNKLIISYSNEELLSINLINMKINNYSIVDNKIYIGKDTTYDSFNNNITKNGITIKVYNNDNNEITSGNLSSDYKLKAYYGEDLIEEYNIVMEYLNLNKLTVDDKNKIIKRINIETKVSQIKSLIDTSGTITVTTSKNKNLSDSDTIKTGDKILIDLNGSKYNYTISTLGDINGDGSITIKDITLIYRYYKGRDDLQQYQIDAADVKNDSKISMQDVSKLYNYYKRRIDTLE